MSDPREKEAFNSLVNIVEMIQERSYASMAKFFDDLFAAYQPKLKQDIFPDAVESSYTGIHLNETYEESDFLKMVDGFRSGQILHAKYALQILKDAIKAFEKRSNVSYCNLKKAKTQLPAVIIVGDLHGSFKDLNYIIQKYGIPGKHFRFVFNGDFVDRGPQQCEVLLTLLFAFLLYPSRVFLNRGNHEDLSVNMNKHFDPNFKKDTDVKFTKFGSAFFNQAQRLFRRLPIATVIENNVGYKVFVCHGGISKRLDLEYLVGTGLNRFSFPSITLKDKESREARKAAEQFSDLLWSDPLKNDKQGCEPNKNRGIGWLFGSDVSDEFCQRNGFNTIVRSHEVRDKGYSQDHRCCFTIFSSSFYCSGQNKAAVLILGADKRNLEVHSWQTDPLHPEEFDQEKKNILVSFKDYIEREAPRLIPKFKRVDDQRNGWIRMDDWATILADHVSKDHTYMDPQHLITLKDYLCPCDENSRRVNYLEMFSNPHQNQANSQALQLLDDIFALIDLDANGTLSHAEAEEAINILNKSMGTKYSTKFITHMDTDRNGFVDFQEFKIGFAKAFNMQ